LFPRGGVLLPGELGFFLKENSLLPWEVVFFTKKLFFFHEELFGTNIWSIFA
jgi:hypothetical protein